MEVSFLQKYFQAVSKYNKDNVSVYIYDIKFNHEQTEFSDSSSIWDLNMQIVYQSRYFMFNEILCSIRVLNYKTFLCFIMMFITAQKSNKVNMLYIPIKNCFIIT